MGYALGASQGRPEKRGSEGARGHRESEFSQQPWWWVPRGCQGQEESLILITAGPWVRPPST